MGIRDEHGFYEVLFFGPGCNPALAATPLGLIISNWLRLRVPLMRQGNHHILRRNQIFVFKVFMAIDDLGTASIAILVPDIDQFVANNLHQSIGISEDPKILPDTVQHLQVFGTDFLLFQPGQAVQSKIQDRLCLGCRQAITVRARATARLCLTQCPLFQIGRLQHLGDHGRFPRLTQ